MGLNDSINKDVLDTLKILETQNHSDKIATLTLLLETYTHKNKAMHLMDSYDLSTIISSSKNKMSTESFPKFLKSNSLTKQVNQDHQILLCMVEATIGHMNKLDCLKRLPKFDYKEK